MALAVAIPPTPNARRLPNPPPPPPGITFGHPGKTIRANIGRREDFIPPQTVVAPPPQIPASAFVSPPAPLSQPSPPSPAYGARNV